jgi:hypothetical protein
MPFAGDVVVRNEVLRAWIERYDVQCMRCSD